MMRKCIGESTWDLTHAGFPRTSSQSGRQLSSEAEESPSFKAAEAGVPGLLAAEGPE